MKNSPQVAGAPLPGCLVISLPFPHTITCILRQHPLAAMQIDTHYLQSMTMWPEVVHDPVPDILICNCLDGVLAIGQNISFHHTEPIQEVSRRYSQIFNCPAFLKTTATTAELEWLATRKHDKDLLWMLAEPLALKCWSFTQILAVATVEARAAVGVRGLEDVRLETGIRTLRWRLQNIRKKAEDQREIPRLSFTRDISACGCSASFLREAVIKENNGGWRLAKREELPESRVTVRASAEQVLWLSQLPNFSPVLKTLQERFGETEIEVESVLALDAAVNIGTFRHTLEAWLEGVDGFIRELERMLIEGVTV